jgi:hypothetical protein
MEATDGLQRRILKSLRFRSPCRDTANKGKNPTPAITPGGSGRAWSSYETTGGARGALGGEAGDGPDSTLLLGGEQDPCAVGAGLCEIVSERDSAVRSCPRLIPVVRCASPLTPGLQIRP